MYKVMKILAIAVLIVTIAGAGAVLYGIRTLSPVVEQVYVTVTPAGDAQDVFDGALAQVADGTFTGRVFSAGAAPDAEECTFLTYTVRLANRGFFPAEWVSLDVQPVEGDVLQLDNVQAKCACKRQPGGYRCDDPACRRRRCDQPELYDPVLCLWQENHAAGQHTVTSKTDKPNIKKKDRRPAILLFLLPMLCAQRQAQPKPA